MLMVTGEQIVDGLALISSVDIAIRRVNSSNQTCFTGDAFYQSDWYRVMRVALALITGALPSHKI